MKIVFLSQIPDLFCYCILPILHMCCFPATNSPVGSWGNFGLFLFSALFLLPRSYTTVQIKHFFFTFFLPSSILQHTRLTVLPLFWVFLLCLRFCKWIIFFASVFVERKKYTKQNKWALWNVKEAVKQQSWKRHLNCITNGSSYLIEKQRSRYIFFFFL